MLGESAARYGGFIRDEGGFAQGGEGHSVRKRAATCGAKIMTEPTNWTTSGPIRLRVVTEGPNTRESSGTTDQSRNNDRTVVTTKNFSTFGRFSKSIVVVLTADHSVAPAIENAKHQSFNAEGFGEAAWLGELKTRFNEEFRFGSNISGSKIFTGQIFLGNHITGF